MAKKEKTEVSKTPKADIINSKRKKGLEKMPLGAARRVLSAQSVMLAERRYRVVNLRKEGHSIIDIAKELQVQPCDVTRDLSFMLDITLTQAVQTVEETRELQVQRLDDMIKAYTPLALNSRTEIRVSKSGDEYMITIPPDPTYADIILKCEQRRAKLLGLDMPEVKNVEITGVREYIGITIEDV